MKIYSYNGKGILTLREALHLAFLDLSETKKGLLLECTPLLIQTLIFIPGWKRFMIIRFF